MNVRWHTANQPTKRARKDAVILIIASQVVDARDGTGRRDAETAADLEPDARWQRSKCQRASTTGIYSHTGLVTSKIHSINLKLLVKIYIVIKNRKEVLLEDVQDAVEVIVFLL